MTPTESAALRANLARQDARAKWRAGIAESSNWRWYISIAAISEYMAITGCSGPLEDSNPDFIRAEQELGAHSQTARLTPHVLRSGAVTYRSGKMKIRGRGGRRLEFVVAEVPRAEGPLPQLVSVRSK